MKIPYFTKKAQGLYMFTTKESGYLLEAAEEVVEAQVLSAQLVLSQVI
tara:strand:+ start:448 stop:591 length:144 start_codon:yes stop_codon:yes gene_type:complete